MIMKKYDIFLFDADNTLYDYDKAEAYALKTMFERRGFDYSEDIRIKYRAINDPLWESLAKGEISKDDLQTIRFAKLFNEIGVQYNEVDFNASYLVELGKAPFLINGAEDICKAIVYNNKQVYIVTNGVMATQESRIKYSLLKDYISNSFVSEVVGYVKPDIRYFDYVFTNIPQVSKDKILIIGDSLTADITGGNKAGIDSCWFNIQGIQNNTDIQPTYEIHCLSELHKFV